MLFFFHCFSARASLKLTVELKALWRIVNDYINCLFPSGLFSHPGPRFDLQWQSQCAIRRGSVPSCAELGETWYRWTQATRAMGKICLTLLKRISISLHFFCLTIICNTPSSQLMKCVRLPLLRRDFLMSNVDTELLVRHHSECKDLLIEALKYHLMPEQRGVLSNSRTRPRRCEGASPVLFAVGQCAPEGTH